MGGPYRIYAKAAKKTGDDSASVLQDGITDSFVSHLKNKVLILKDKPATSNEKVSFDPSDEWAKYFAKLDNKGTAALSLTVDKNNGQTIVSFECQLLAAWSLTFTSHIDTVSTALKAPVLQGGSPHEIPTVSAPGIDQDGQTLYLAYLPEKSLSVSLKDLFAFVGFGTRQTNSFPSTLHLLTVTLDPSKVQGNRNLLWFEPAFDSRVVLRLQFKLDIIDALAKHIEGVLPGFKINSADVICKKIVMAASTTTAARVNESSIIFGLDSSITAHAGTPKQAHLDLLASVEYTILGVSITFQPKSSTENALDTLMSWVKSLLQDEDIDDIGASMNQTDGEHKLFENIRFRRLRMQLQKDGSKDELSISRFSVDIQVDGHFGTKDNKPVAFLIHYQWSQQTGGIGSLTGSLWNTPDLSVSKLLDPSYEVYSDLEPWQGSEIAKSLDLINLIPGQPIQNVPENIAHELTNLNLELSEKNIRFSATVGTTGERDPGALPMPSLDEVNLRVSYTWGDDKGLLVEFRIKASLQPSSTSKQKAPASLRGSIRYLSDSDTKSWTLNAGVQDLYASTLREFFDQSAAEHVMPLIDSIAIESLDVTYTYATETAQSNTGSKDTDPKKSKDSSNTDPKKSVAKSFEIHGVILIASLCLNLDFVHPSEGQWTFSASLRAKGKATVREILAGILGDDELELPSFLAETSFGDGDDLRITVQRASGLEDTGSADGDYFRFLAVVHIGPCTLTFIQYHDAKWPKGTPSKRIIKASLTSLPKVDIPLVGELVQPFDEMYYMWVQDGTNTNASKTPGINRAEVTMLNKLLEAVGKEVKTVKTLVFKEKYKDTKNQTHILVDPGSHFAVIISDSTGQRTCLLDYQFGSTTTKPEGQTKESEKKLPSPIPSPENKLPDETKSPSPPQPSPSSSKDSSDDANGTAHAPLKKKSGSLNISSIGLKYAKKILQVKFSASMELGPVAFELLGLAINIEMTSLTSIKFDSVELEGLSAAFEKPPLTIAGLMRHQKTEKMESYAGGLIVGFKMWQFEAAGFYGIVTPDGATSEDQKFKSIFVFARLDGPLVTLEFAEISGITGGFGYNSLVNMPRVDQVTDFPFVAKQSLDGAAGDALKTLEKLTGSSDGWFAPQNGTYWAAAGLKVDAFQMLVIDAVVVVQFGPSIKLGIFAVAIADLPASVGNTNTVKFAHVELGIAVTVDFDYGVLKAEAQLSPQSYILHPDCHLTGGFALVYWFDAPHANQDLVGNFVFTIGGYHAAFQVPVGWPNPPRLGISWSLGSNLSVTGEAYFAITPKVCMGGGRLHAAFAAGPIRAWFDASADFLINFQPFHFIAGVKICVGVSFNVDFLFIHIHISCEIGADLTLWGPPLAGRVHVDLWVAAFNINFGDSLPTVDKITLFEFYKLVSSAGDKSTMPSLPAGQPRPMNEGHNFLVQEGLMSDADAAKSGKKEPSAMWLVRAGSFAFIIDSKMAVGEVNKGTDTPVKYTEKPIFAKPMQIDSPMTSTMTVTISRQDNATKKDIPNWFARPVIKSVPSGSWSSHNDPSDPLAAKDSGIPLMMGVRYTVPIADMSPDKLPILRIEEADIVTIIAERPFPNTATQAFDGWNPIPPKKDERSGKVVVDSSEWEKVRKCWAREVDGDDKDKSKRKKALEDQKTFVGGWAAALGWTEEKLDEIAAIPRRVNMRFSDMYVAVPVLTK